MGVSSGNHVLFLHRMVGSVFNEQDNLLIFLSQNKFIEALQRQTPLSWYLATFHIFFCCVFQGVSFNYHQRNVRFRSRLLWQSLGFGGYGLDYITARDKENGR